MHTILKRVCCCLALTVLASPLLAVTSQNQCPGDCSPCLGPTDPFCRSSGSTGSGGGSGGGTCQKCGQTLMPTANGGWIYVATCDPVTNGDGATGCSLSFLFSTCTLSGNFCSVITVYP